LRGTFAQLAWVDVFDRADAVLATVLRVDERLADAESSDSAVVAAVVGVVAALDAVERVAVAVLVVAAMQPVSANRPATLTAPASLRARRAGWGRRRRGWVVVFIISPPDWNESRIGAAGKRRVGAGEEADKKNTAEDRLLARFLPISQGGRKHCVETAGMPNEEQLR
jgi:hypothetical protein